MWLHLIWLHLDIIELRKISYDFQRHGLLDNYYPDQGPTEHQVKAPIGPN